jgi:hypothetical protein
MTKPTDDAGVLVTLIERFEKYRLPRLLELKERVDKGEKLSDLDMEFLKEVFDSSKDVKPYIDRHAGLQDLAAQAMGIYSDVMDKATENEKNS